MMHPHIYGYPVYIFPLKGRRDSFVPGHRVSSVGHLKFAYTTISAANLQPVRSVKEFWAHFRRSAPETGLSACIFCLVYQAKGYRFYPLRGPKPLCGFGLAEFREAKLQDPPVCVDRMASPFGLGSFVVNCTLPAAISNSKTSGFSCFHGPVKPS
jgi:hypothetical protein